MAGNYFFKKRVSTITVYVLLSVIALYTLAPLWFLFVNSFKGQAEIVNNPMGLPSKFDFQYIFNAIEKINFFRAMGITILITVSAVALIALVSYMSAWIMVRTKSKMSSFLFMAFVAAMLIPFQAIMYPLIRFFNDIGLKNPPWNCTSRGFSPASSAIRGS
jgi:raffinose/stachyose/melibiose transport system permease protein